MMQSNKQFIIKSDNNTTNNNLINNITDLGMCSQNCRNNTHKYLGTKRNLGSRHPFFGIKWPTIQDQLGSAVQGGDEKWAIARDYPKPELADLKSEWVNFKMAPVQ